MISHNISLKKIIVNRTKLRCARQRIFDNRNSIKKLKSIRERNIITYNIYESQKFIAFYNNKTIKQKTNKIIKTVKTILVHYTVYT